jgi:hypothetical protein
MFFLFFPLKNVDNHGDCRNEEDTTTNRGNEATMKIPNINTTMGKSRLPPPPRRRQADAAKPPPSCHLQVKAVISLSIEVKNVQTLEHF